MPESLHPVILAKILFEGAVRSWLFVYDQSCSTYLCTYSPAIYMTVVEPKTTAAPEYIYVVTIDPAAPGSPELTPSEAMKKAIDSAMAHPHHARLRKLLRSAAHEY